MCGSGKANLFLPFSSSVFNNHGEGHMLRWHNHNIKAAWIFFFKKQVTILYIYQQFEADISEQEYSEDDHYWNTLVRVLNPIRFVDLNRAVTETFELPFSSSFAHISC